MRWTAPLAPLLLLAMASCLQPSSTVVPSCEGCEHRSTTEASRGGGSTAATSSGNASTAGASSGSGTSSGSSSGTGSSTVGSSGGGSSSGQVTTLDGGGVFCPAVLAPAPVVSCPSGDRDYSSQLVDVVECTIIGDAEVQALDPNGIPYPQATGTSSSTDGTFALCLPSQSPFTVEVTAAAYPNSVFAELDGTGSGTLQIALLSTEFLAAADQVGGIVIDGGAAVLVKANATSGCGQALAGWTIGLSFPDGGSLPNGSYQMRYFASSGFPQAGLTATSAFGAALFYNLDSSLSSEFLRVFYQNPDAGSCQPINASRGYTGRIYVNEGAVSGYPILLP